jgi:predicted O-methyltransferase YrrM
MIRKTDYGSGSGELTVDQYPVKISHLARYSSLPPHRSARLYHLVRFLKAQHILELGTSLGISAAYMAKSNPGARILTLEGCSEVAKLARNNLIDLAIDNVQIIEGNFDKKLSEALNSMDAPDLVFIDGNHRQEPTVQYFRQLVDAAHNNTMFVFDDIHYSREMEQAWQQIISFPEVTASIDLFHQGWVMIKNELSPQHLILNYP